LWNWLLRVPLKINTSKPDKARPKNRSAAYVGICKQDFSDATQYGDEVLILRGARALLVDEI
jgi:hypothetical protein